MMINMHFVYVSLGGGGGEGLYNNSPVPKSGDLVMSMLSETLVNMININFFMERLHY